MLNVTHWGAIFVHVDGSGFSVVPSCGTPGTLLDEAEINKVTCPQCQQDYDRHQRFWASRARRLGLGCHVPVRQADA